MDLHLSCSKLLEAFGRGILSHFLFIVVVEALTSLLVKARELAVIEGFEVGGAERLSLIFKCR